jgi:lipopolysaccharide/colanic/teichoic acid biosynthesis glycosyltransferase
MEQGARGMRRWARTHASIRADELLRIASWPFGGSRSRVTRQRHVSRRRALTKRSFDIVLSVSLLILLAVPLTLIALAVKLDSPGPVFYRVRRVGFRGGMLTMLKFRKMHDDARGIPLTANADPRLTRVGRILARTRLDELPQLWDVLRGSMSIVGPRPEAPEFVALHADAYAHILSVRPGITGLSQLAFAEEHFILDQSDLIGDYVGRILPQKVGLDTLYARDYGCLMDVKVLIWTAVAMLAGKRVSVHRRTGGLTIRRRPRPVAAGIPVAAAISTAVTRLAAPHEAPDAERPAAEAARAA